MVSELLPEVANRVTDELFRDEVGAWCLGELQDSADLLDRSVCQQAKVRDSSKAEHVHQNLSVLILVSGFTAGNTARLVLPSSTIGAPSHCPSPLPSTYLTLGRLLDLLPAAFSNGSPTSMELRSNLALSISVRLCVTENHGECDARFDETGRQRTACARSQRLPARALPPETTLARVRRDVGATVRCNGEDREMNVTMQVPDERVLELLASGLSPT